MSRPRTETIHALKAKLLARLTDGFHRPGDRFLSNRALAARYGVSYQTAHRLIAELCAEGHLERRRASGTYISGRPAPLTGVELWFSPRARRRGSFGANLLALLQRALTDAGIAHSVRWAGAAQHEPAAQSYPVLWEAPAVLARVTAARHYALLLNHRPAPGLEASLIDAIATDDFSAGVCAAQVLQERSPTGRRFAVMAALADDRRSQQRVAGFRAHLPTATVVEAGGWYFEHAAKVARRAVTAGADGLFCVNDRMASAVLANCRRLVVKPPPLIGHDNAPIAEELHLTTIAIPWEELAATALKVIELRLGSFSGAARQTILAQRPVFRLSV